MLYLKIFQQPTADLLLYTIYEQYETDQFTITNLFAII